jgi:flagellar biosynthesis chaperone FliJ
VEIVEKVRQQLKQLDGIRSDQQKKIGERDGILKQLNDLGYKTIDEARVALKELEAQHDQISMDLEELSKEMDTIIMQANSSTNK